MGYKIKREGKYTSLSLPTDIIDNVEKWVRNDYRYRSITDFVKWAVIEKFENDGQPRKIELK